MMGNLGPAQVLLTQKTSPETDFYEVDYNHCKFVLGICNPDELEEVHDYKGRGQTWPVTAKNIDFALLRREGVSLWR